MSKTGEEVAYYILDSNSNKIKKVDKIGKKSKRLFVIHAANLEYADQTRGLPFLSGVLHELRKISDYSLYELQAAVINAVLAVWVEPSSDNDSSMPFAGVKAKTDLQTPAEDALVEKKPVDAIFSKGGLIVQNLKKGEKVNSFDTKRPNVNFDGFTTSIMKYLSSSSDSSS